MCPFGIRGVSLWVAGFCFYRVVEQRAVPAVEIAGRCNLGSLGVIGGALSQPPMSGDAIAIDAEAGTGGLDDEAVVLQFTEPALHRSAGICAEIGGGVEVGSEHLCDVQMVVTMAVTLT